MLRGSLGPMCLCFALYFVELGATIVTWVDADLRGTEVAVIAMLGGSGTLSGAMYKPEAETVPHADFVKISTEVHSERIAHSSVAIVHIGVAIPLAPTFAENSRVLPTATVTGPDGEMLTGTSFGEVPSTFKL